MWRRSNISFNLFRVLTHEIKIKPFPKVCSYHSKILTDLNHYVAIIKPINLSCTSIRCKSKKQSDPDSDDETTIQDDDASLSRDSKVVKFSTTSLRTDAILKSALGIARNKIETLFYESKIRVNGKKILKKSAPVREDYEIDVIKSISPKNPEHLYISRIEILSIAAKEESIFITARRFKTLLIENYEDDPYKASTAEDQ